MSGDGRNCTPVDECVEAEPCFDGVQCVEHDNGYECGGCPPGFRGNSKRGYNLTDAHTKQVGIIVLVYVANLAHYLN